MIEQPRDFGAVHGALRPVSAARAADPCGEVRRPACARRKNSGVVSGTPAVIDDQRGRSAAAAASLANNRSSLRG
jgi:hypothetical protein